MDGLNLRLADGFSFSACNKTIFHTGQVLKSALPSGYTNVSAAPTSISLPLLRSTFQEVFEFGTAMCNKIKRFAGLLHI
jgi:hypothetical protein